MTVISGSSIAKSLSVMGFDLQHQMAAKQEEGVNSRSRVAESDQQFQVDVAGEATGVTAWTTTTVQFDETIFLSPAQRYNPLPEPHFTFGSTMQSGSPVMLHATVQKWIRDSSSNFTGAVVAIGVTGIAGEGAVKYKARVHLTFQGLSAPEFPVTGIGEG